MKRIVAFAAAALTSVMLLGATATPAFAAGSAPGYRLVPVSAITAATSFVASETLWKCAESGCVARAATSRPEIVCARAAKEVGPVASFSHNGKELDAEALAKCNEKAR